MDHKERSLYMAQTNILPSYTNDIDKIKREVNSRERIEENPNKNIKHNN